MEDFYDGELKAVWGVLKPLWMRKHKGYSVKFWKKMAHKRFRRSLRHAINGGSVRFKPLTRLDID